VTVCTVQALYPEALKANCPKYQIPSGSGAEADVGLKCHHQRITSALVSRNPTSRGVPTAHSVLLSLSRTLLQEKPGYFR
jgi:hypothetical protein